MRGPGLPAGAASPPSRARRPAPSRSAGTPRAWAPGPPEGAGRGWEGAGRLARRRQGERAGPRPPGSGAEGRGAGAAAAKAGGARGAGPRLRARPRRKEGVTPISVPGRPSPAGLAAGAG